jgi:hypothetical protein
MLVFNSMADHDENWSTFAADPEWRKLSTTPGYTDPESVSNISNIFLCPTAYSRVSNSKREPGLIKLLRHITMPVGDHRTFLLVQFRSVTHEWLQSAGSGSSSLARTHVGPLNSQVCSQAQLMIRADVGRSWINPQRSNSRHFSP